MILKYQSEHTMIIQEYAYLKGINKTLLKDIKLYGDILVNGEHQRVIDTVNKGDEIAFIFPKETCDIPQEDIPLHIIYEDDYLLIIDKPSNMPSIPTRKYQSGTLANALSYYYQKIGLSSTIHIVNRLDKDTRGLMIVAKYRYVHDLFSKEHIYRIYRAHVEGEVTQGTIDKPIYKDGIQVKRIIDERGKPSVTYYKQKGEYVYFKLETGRTHQIRIHMASIGHPLIGDVIYGSSEGEFDLESIIVGFVHPITKQVINIRKK